MAIMISWIWLITYFNKSNMVAT